MRVLFLDDSAIRIQRAYETFANDHLEVVVSSEAAITALVDPELWDLVMLDHDLGGKHWAPSDEESGMEVVRWIVENKPTIGRIVVHSWNNVAAPVMTNRLKKAGYETAYIPFEVVQ